jgi:hypothetical protein
MGSSKSSEEIKQEIIAILGKEVGSLYDSIYTGFLEVSFKWVEYKELFGTKESRLKILNDAAPFFFYIVQQILWENILLGICRLTDPPKTAGKKNASINALSEFISNAEFGKSVSLKVDAIMDATEFCRDWRNRFISHSDYDLATDELAKPLENASRAKVEVVLTLFGEYLNLYQNHYFNVTTVFSMIESRRSALSLLAVLDEGLESKKNRLERIRSGTYSEADLRKKEL